MDSVTQFALGAAIGEATLGKKVGNKAVWWGGFAGSLPDFDVLFTRIIGGVDGFMAHRGFSHSFLFAILAAPLLGWLVAQFHRRRPEASWRDWTYLFFLGIVTHPLLDALTTYGTGLLEPFSNARLAYPTIFIIDPLYTLPLLWGFISVLRWSRDDPKRAKRNRMGLYLAHAYLLLTLFHKQYVTYVVEKQLDQQKIVYEKFETTPSLFNNFVWQVTVRTAEGVQMGFYKAWASDQPIAFRFFPRQEEVAKPLGNGHTIQTLKRFSQGYYVFSKQADGVRLHDLRFGILGAGEQPFVFSFKLTPRPDGDTDFTQERPDMSKVDLKSLNL